MVRVGQISQSQRAPARWPSVRCWSMLLLATLAFTSSHADDARPPTDPEMQADLARAQERLFSPTPAGHRAEVARSEALGHRLHVAAAAPDLALSADAVALKTRALSAGLPTCKGLVFQPVLMDAVQDSASGKPTRYLYLLASHPTETLVVSGIHYRLALSDDATGFDTIKPSTNTCVAVNDTTPLFYIFSHVRSCAPNEFHVYLSLRHGKPIVIATTVGRWLVDQGQIHLVSKHPQLCSDRRVSTQVNRWVALANGISANGKYLISMPYMDWKAGLTAHMAGEARRDDEGRFHWLRRIAPDSPQFKVRLTEPGQARHLMVATLPEQAILDLALEDPPPWLSTYARPGDPQDIAIALGSYLNHLADPEGAVHHLEPLQTGDPDRSRKRAFELGYAFNAQHRPDSALRVLLPAEKNAPNDPDLCREIAFPRASLNEFPLASQQYSRCFRLTPQSAVGFRMEIARQQVVLARALGAPDRCREWLQILQTEMARVPPGDPAEALAGQFRGLTCDQ